ncbi:hypothetical protein OESDEN_06319 [Oesophagostomum dentatum]|uniref:Uncharacterized protein n=1 Tax=Oesophagostomum dentatum TaxID=61180 RepID=A0A0B1T947_OESDE|nr:hypothetical protein OESDEN_06319 [Oesophagostomum dentatum]
MRVLFVLALILMGAGITILPTLQQHHPGSSEQHHTHSSEERATRRKRFDHWGHGGHWRRFGGLGWWGHGHW